MITVHALYDGEVFRPEAPVNLSPHTRVYLVIEPTGQAISDRAALTFLRIAQPLEPVERISTRLEKVHSLPLDRAEDVMRLKENRELTDLQRETLINAILRKKITIEGTIFDVRAESIVASVGIGLVFLHFSPPPSKDEFLRLRKGQPFLAYGVLSRVESYGLVAENCAIVER